MAPQRRDTYLKAEAADGLAVLERLLRGDGGSQLDEIDTEGVESLGTVVLGVFVS